MNRHFSNLIRMIALFTLAFGTGVVGGFSPAWAGGEACRALFSAAHVAPGLAESGASTHAAEALAIEARVKSANPKTLRTLSIPEFRTFTQDVSDAVSAKNSKIANAPLELRLRFLLLSRKAKGMLKSGALTYGDVLQLAFDFSRASGDLLAVEGKTGKYGNDRERIRIASSWWPRKLVSLAHQEVYIPTMRSLGFDDFLDLAARPVFYLGVTDQLVSYDGIDADLPFNFLIHDITHASRMRHGTPEQQAKAAAYLRYVRKAARSLSPREQLAVSLILFEVHHERNTVFSDLDQVRARLSESWKPLFSKLQDRYDYGMDPELGSLTREEIFSAVRFVQRETEDFALSSGMKAS